jgi:transcriptional regulator with XRE-family HTH domain
MPAKRKSKPRSPDHAALGQAIEMVIAENPKMSRDRAATDSGLDIRQISSYVCGQGNPSYTTLLKLAHGLDVKLGKLMTLADRLREEQARG